MRTAIFALILVLSGCSNPSKSAAPKELTFDNINSLVLGKTSKVEVVQLFGAPSSQEVHEKTIKMNYNDRLTGAQRATINIAETNQSVSGFLWLPFDSDRELALDALLAHLGKASFEEVKLNEPPTHYVTDIIMLRDKKSGYSIRYDRGRKEVEGVGRFSPANRTVAGSTAR